MYLKRLDIYGFKSFSEKTSLSFGPGLTAIVGPNGSGKSNVSDSIRWVLGEQSAKSLRGQRMEDVIFSGTEFRRGVALAEVSLTLSNDCGSLSWGGEKPEEVTVSRRLYRSGESQYLINGGAARLKDVHELFMDTGLGREGYSIIGQGRIEDILSVKSEDRRSIFEEAAGIIKYKSRRDEAHSKLERERRAFDRVCDIIKEIESSLEPMAQMAEKARKYLELTERLKLVRLNVFRNMDEGWAEQERLAKDNLDGIILEMEKSRLEKEEKQTLSNNMSGRLELLTQTSEDNREALSELVLNIQKLENDIRLAQAGVEYFDDRKNRLSKELIQKQANIETFAKDKLELLDKLMNLAEEIVEKGEEAKTLRDELSQKERAAAQSEQELEEISSRHIESLESASGVKSKAEGLASAYSAHEERKERLNEELQSLREILKSEQESLSILEASLRDNLRLTETAKSDMERYGTSKEKLENEYSALKDTHKKETEFLSEARSRHKLLTELEESLEGYHHSVRSLLNAVKSGRIGLKGLRGAVGELISVKPKYETCVEVALGGSITDIITDDEEAAKAAIAYLKSAKTGRATFLPLTAIKPRKLDNRTSILSERGIHGAAADFTDCDPVYRDIIDNLLGRVIAAEDMDTAVAFARKYRYGYKIVTLGGEIINPGGAITGGWLGKTAGILTRRRTIAELSETIKASEAQAIKRNAQLDGLSGKLSGVIQGLERSKVTMHELQIKRAALEADINKDKKTVKDYTGRIMGLEQTDLELDNLLSDINLELRESKEKQKSVETNVSGLLAEIGDLREELKNRKKTLGEVQKRCASLEIELSRLGEAAVSAQKAVDASENASQAETKAIGAIRAELEALEIEKEAKLNQIEELKNRSEILSANKITAESGLKELTVKVQELESSLKELRAYEMESIKHEANLKMELERLGGKKEVMEADRRRILDELWDEYGATPRDAQNCERLGLTPAKLKQEENSIRSELRGMGGSVNVGAAEEYRLIKERHSFLIKQRDDILNAEKTLEGVIAELNSLMESRFREEFGKISDNFTAVFTEMFGGGAARLKLADESDALGSGIEIEAQPPGKSLQSMSLLSGGERALCAIALLFAILRLKPSPFCVLDEIETALDDANVKRFARFIKNYTAGTQFIVITHRKGTMEFADALYGVTMQEAGVSKLISVKFSDNEEKTLIG